MTLEQDYEIEWEKKVFQYKIYHLTITVSLLTIELKNGNSYLFYLTVNIFKKVIKCNLEQCKSKRCKPTANIRIKKFESIFFTEKKPIKMQFVKTFFFFLFFSKASCINLNLYSYCGENNYNKLHLF